MTPIYHHFCPAGHTADILISIDVASAERNGTAPPRTCYHMTGEKQCGLPMTQGFAPSALKRDGAYSFNDGKGEK